MDIVIQLLKSGLDALIDYLSLHVLTCLVPAFLLLALSQFLFLKRQC